MLLRVARLWAPQSRAAVPAASAASVGRAIGALPSLRHVAPSQQQLPTPRSFAALLRLPPQRQLSTQTKVTKANRFVLSVTEGNLPNAATISYKPTSPGRRHRIVIDKSHLWPGRPEKSLTSRINSKAGRNHTGRICTRGRTAPKHRQIYRHVDFRRERTDPAVVLRFEYDPNRSAFIALIKYQSDGALSYILAPSELAVGSTVSCGEEAALAPGNSMRLGRIPDGTELHNIEVRKGGGGKIVRGAGTAAKLMSKDEAYATLKLPSGEIRKIPAACVATIGALSNDQWRNRVLGKAGANRWVGRRSKVRGVAMNPVDHPMGGGEGKSSGGRPSSSPWGWYTKGLRTRNRKQFSSKLIMRRRNHEKLGLASTNTGGW